MHMIPPEGMGEVRVKVRLSNMGDVELMERGLLEPSKVRRCNVEAIVDSGATRSVIPQEVADRLGLSIRRRDEATLADGRIISVGVSSPMYFEIEGREGMEDAYVVGNTVLIGQTVLEITDLLVDCKNRKVIPNPDHPNGPLHRI